MHLVLNKLRLVLKCSIQALLTWLQKARNFGLSFTPALVTANPETAVPMPVSGHPLTITNHDGGGHMTDDGEDTEGHGTQPRRPEGTPSPAGTQGPPTPPGPVDTSPHNDILILTDRSMQSTTTDVSVPNPSTSAARDQMRKIQSTSGTACQSSATHG